MRNPLISSGINSEIKNTLINNPSYFWYYNNGITAITKKIPKIGRFADIFKIQGIQIINGAQTAFSISRAMKEINSAQRAVIDSEAKITLRLIKSGGREFDLNVTKFTNSQNPVHERDFYSGDDIQEKIQDYFLSTNIWYERRDGEFRNIESVKDDIELVPNMYMANAYLAFCLLDPCAVLDAAFQRESGERDIVFTSHKDHPSGLYEKIFGPSLIFDDLYAAFCVFDTLTDINSFRLERVFYTNGFHIIAISSIIIERYLQNTHGSSINISKAIIKDYQEGDKFVIKKALALSSDIINKKISSRARSMKITVAEYRGKILTEKSAFDAFLDDVRKIPVDFKAFDRQEKKK